MQVPFSGTIIPRIGGVRSESMRAGERRNEGHFDERNSRRILLARRHDLIKTTGDYSIAPVWKTEPSRADRGGASNNRPAGRCRSITDTSTSQPCCLWSTTLSRRRKDGRGERRRGNSSRIAWWESTGHARETKGSRRLRCVSSLIASRFDRSITRPPTTKTHRWNFLRGNRTSHVRHKFLDWTKRVPVFLFFCTRLRVLGLLFNVIDPWPFCRVQLPR